MKEYVSLIEQSMKEDSFFPEARRVAEMNSQGGKVWIVGSFLYKNILRQKYGLENLEVEDYDFILENQVPFEQTRAPEGWKINKTYFGDPRINKGNLQVDVFPVSKLVFSSTEETWNKLSLDEKMDVYLSTTPFSVQAMAYELKSGKLHDKGSIEAINSRRSKVPNVKSCIAIAKKRNITLEEYLQSKSNQFGIPVLNPLKSQEQTVN